MRVIPTGPTWLTWDDFRAVLVPDRRSTCELENTLEQELARYFGRQHAVLTSSGTAGIYLALKAQRLPAYSEVMTPAYTCIRVPHAITASGLVPRFVDVDETANMNAEAVSKACLTAKARVVLLTHLYGNPARVEALIGLAEARGLIVIEDACMTFDAGYGGRRCGTFGRASVFSLNRAKIVSAFGGGVVLTDDAALAAEMRSLRDREIRPLDGRTRSQLWRTLLTNNLIFNPWLFGNVGKRLAHVPLVRRINQPSDTTHFVPVRLTPLADFQLRLALSQLRRARWFAARRHSIAESFSRGLEGINAETIKTDPAASPGWSHYSLILDRARSRADVSGALVRHGVQPGELFNYVCPLTQAYRALGQTGFPQAAHFARRIINLPFHPYLSNHDQAQIIAGARAVLGP